LIFYNYLATKSKNNIKKFQQYERPQGVRTGICFPPGNWVS